MSEAVLRQREETKKIKEKRRREKEEKMKLLNKKPVKHSKTPKKTIHSSVETKNDLEFGMSEAVKQKRAEIKAIKEKRRKSKLQTSVPASSMTKPSKLAKKKSKRDTTKHKITDIPEKRDSKVNGDNNNKDRDGHETKKPKRRLSKLKSQGTGGIEPTVDLYQTELASLKEQNIELKKQLKMSDFIKKKYELLKNENTLFKEQVAVLNEENEALKAENAELRKKLEAGGIKIDNTAFDHDDVMDTYDANDDDRGKSQIDPKLLANGSNDDANKDDDEKDITNNSNSSSSSSSSNSNSNNNSESDSDSDDAEETNNGATNNAAKKLEQLKKQQEEDSDSDSDSSDDDAEIPPEEEEPDQGESEEVQQDKENEDVNGAKMNGDDGDGNDSDDGSGSQSASASQSSEENEWEEWEPPQIADWMISLDGKYKKYEKQLRKQLAEEEMHGSLLGELDESDLDRFGIKSDKHKKAIMVELKKLTAD